MTQLSLTLGLHMETGDSGLDQFVLVEGYAASVLLKNQQLMTNSLDWGTELLNLSDLNSTTNKQKMLVCLPKHVFMKSL